MCATAVKEINSDAFDELEDEIKQEFYEDVVAAISDINECATTLESGADAQVIDRMFRSLHTVKGNCNMVFLEAFVDATHKLEDLFSDIRSGEIEYHDSYGKFAVVVVNEVQSQLESLIKSRGADASVLAKLEKIIDQIENNPPDQRLDVTERAIIAVSDGHYNLELVSVDQDHGHSFSFVDATDFEFFQFICDKQCLADPKCETFFMVFEQLALKLNSKLGRKVDEDQLKACVIFFTLSNVVRHTDSSSALTIDQVFFASGILNRMSGWSVASDLVLQTLENHDGTGLPHGLSNDAIHPAAQVLGLSSEFAYMVCQNFSLGYKQSLFTAVKAINAQKDTRYKSRLIERFNALIKSEYLTSQMW